MGAEIELHCDDCSIGCCQDGKVVCSSCHEGKSNQIKDLEEEASSLESQLGDMQSNAEDLMQDVSDLQAENEALEQKVAYFLAAYNTMREVNGLEPVEA